MMERNLEEKGHGDDANRTVPVSRPVRKWRWLRYGCSIYFLISVVGLLILGGGCFSAMRGIGGGPRGPTVGTVVMDTLTFPIQAIVFGPMWLDGVLGNLEYQSRRAAFSNQCEQAYAEVKANPEILIHEGVGGTVNGSKNFKAIADNSIDLSDRALLTVARDALSSDSCEIERTVFLRKEWRADTLRMIEPWVFMSRSSRRLDFGEPYFLHPALPQDIAESYTNFPHFLRKHDSGRLLEYARKGQCDLFARRKSALQDSQSPVLREIDSFVLGIIGSVQSVTNWQRSGMWDSCVCGDPVSNLIFVTERGVSATVTKMYARRQGTHPLTWQAGDPLVDPTIQAMVLDFTSAEDCIGFIKELVPVCNLVEPRFWSKIYYRPELKTGRVFAVCTERAGSGIGKRLFIVNLAADLDVRFWTPIPQFRNNGPWATCE